MWSACGLLVICLCGLWSACGPQYQVEGLANLLETNGSTIRQILFSHGTKNERLLAVLSVRMTKSIFSLLV